MAAPLRPDAAPDGPPDLANIPAGLRWEYEFAEPFDRLVSEAEFLSFIEHTESRYEYVDGQVYGMAPPTRSHARILSSIHRRVDAAARGGPCRVWRAEMHLRMPGRRYIPDLTVACGPEPKDPTTETAPCCLVEVLSPSTRGVDQRDKTPRYRRLASLQTLLLVEQDVRRVEHYSRDPRGRWRRAVHRGAGAVEVPCLPVNGRPLVLTLDEVYEDVELPRAVPRLRVFELAPAYAGAAG